ncbi:MAG: hypothetical protein RUDDFDWM_000549 [Candidatus Fervidibacterota bacterium]
MGREASNKVKGENLRRMAGECFALLFFFIVSPPVLSDPELKLFICEPRKAFWQSEKIYFGLFSPKDVSGELCIYAQAGKTSSAPYQLLKEKMSLKGGETVVWQLPAYFLKPGRYHLIAQINGKVVGKEELHISSILPPTHFLIGSTAPLEENLKIGATWVYLDLYNYAKVDGEGNFIPDPLTPSMFERGVERLISNGLKGFVWQGLWSGYVLHQPFESMASFLDPEIRKVAMQRAELGAQQARRFISTVASLGGMDEPGLNYGIVKEGRFSGQAFSLFPDFFTRLASEKVLKRPLPSDPRELPQDEWLSWMHWRANIMGEFFKEAKQHVKKVDPELPWGQDIYASFAINDGTNPFLQRLNDIPTTHSFMFWRGVAEQSWHFALEKVGRRDKRFHFASNTTYFTPNSPDEVSLAEMVTNYAVMDGVGMLWHLNFQSAKNLKPSFERIRKFGDFILATLPARHPIGVLYSFTEAAMRLKEAGEVPNSEIYRIPRNYAYECFALYHAIRRAGYTVDLIHEWELKEDGLKGRKALFLVGIKHPLPKEIVNRIRDFQRSGGKLFADTTTSWSPPELQISRIPIDMSSYVHRIEDLEKTANELMSKENYTEASKIMRQAVSDALLDEYADVLSTVLAQTLGKFEIEVSKRGIIPGKWVSGEGRYYLLLNDAQRASPQEVEREIKGRKVKLYPASDWDELKGVTVKFNALRSGEAVYILEGRDWATTRRLTLKPGASLKLDFEPTEMKIIAILPQPIEQVRLRAKMVAKQGRFLELTANCYGKGNRLISAALPLKVTITDAQGDQIQLWRSTDSKGVYKESIPIGSNETPGKWRISVEELFSGKKEVVEISVPTSPPSKLKIIPDVLTCDASAIRSLLKSGRKIIIVVGEKASEEEKEIAKELCERLRAKGISVFVEDEHLVWRKGRYPKVFPAIEKRGEKWFEVTEEERERRRKPWVKLRIWAGENGYPPTLPDAFEVGEDLILVGTDSSSTLIKALQRASILPFVANDYFPGKGRGLLEYSWSPFALGKDVILVTGSDPAGVRKAAQELLTLLR